MVNVKENIVFIGFMLNDRQNKLLKAIVENYIATVQPVGSKSLADNFTVSSATIRNEMCELDKFGLIYQPYTSAGRIPTEAGYRYFLENFVNKEKALIKKWQKILQAIAENKEINDINARIKNLIKAVAEISQNAVLVGFGSYDFYYTGLANLFSQPEFSQSGMIMSIAGVVDHLDEVMNSIFFQVNKPMVLLGNENPFDNNCSFVVRRFGYKSKDGIVGILGPQRADYELNFSLLNFISELINKI